LELVGFSLVFGKSWSMNAGIRQTVCRYVIAGNAFLGS